MCDFFVLSYYASVIAPTGQPSSQAPQSMHWSASTTYLLSPSEIAPTGQVSAQAPHWMHSSLITLGIVLSPYKIDSLSLEIILTQGAYFDKHKKAFGSIFRDTTQSNIAIFARGVLCIYVFPFATSYLPCTSICRNRFRT